MPTTAVPKYLDQLPATPCTPEMRESITVLARAKGVSLAEIQRQAFSLFLSENYSITIEKHSENIEEEEPEQA